MGYAAVSLGIFIFIISYFTFNAPKTHQPLPAPSVTTQETVTYCQSVDESQATTFTAPRDDNTKCPNGPSGSYKSGGVDPNNLFGEETTYRLIKKNVPLNRDFFTKEDGSDHSTLASEIGIQTSLDPSKYRLYFPQISGEISLSQAPYSRTRDCGDRSYEHTNRMYFIDYGLAFALVLKDGKPIEVGGTAIDGTSSTFWLTDVFKDINREDEVPAEAFSCDTNSPQAASSSSPAYGLQFPSGEQATDSNQLQLKYFLFASQGNANQAAGQIVNGWVDTCKPAIYLYPKEKQLINVKVFPAGVLSYVDPPYDSSKGWTVWANPNGSITQVNSSLQNSYNYLYYESKIRDEVIKKPTLGWVRLKSELKNLYEEILPKLGLNSKQSADFIEYWEKALPDSPYYFVGIVDPANVDEIEKLEITPKPDSVNRVRIYFERLDTPKTVTAPVISSQGNNKDSNLSVVEWGGMVKNDPNHPFTCSQ